MRITYFRRQAAQRPDKNCHSSLSKINSVMLFGLMGFALLAFAINVVEASGFPRYWTDTSSGYAIGGYDPVDYFVRSKAMRPNTSIEAVFGGVSWRFRNIGNKQAFMAHPEIYAPRFGGVDPYLLARHREVLGNPSLFDVYKDRLYLFYSIKSLSSWRQNRDIFIVHAERGWPKAAARFGLDSGVELDKSNQSGNKNFGPLPPEK
jgi:hypothetical protein